MLNKCVYIILILSLLTSCKQTVREIGEMAVKKGSKELAETSLSEVSEQSLKHMDWDDVLKLLGKENPTLAAKIDNLDSDFQKKIVDLIKTDKSFLDDLSVRSSILDEFGTFTKDASKISTNGKFLYWFTKSDDGKSNLIKDLVLKEHGYYVDFFQKADNKLLGRYKDGVLQFDKSADVYSKNSLFNQNVKLPDVLYKFKLNERTQILLNTDKFGRTIRTEAQNVSIKDISNCIIKPNDNFDFSSSWSKKLSLKVKKYSKGNDVSVTCKYKYLDDKTIPKYAQMEVKVGDQTFKETLENKKHPDFNKKVQQKSPTPKQQMARRDVEEYVPKGNGGINKEGRTIKDICKQPVPDHILDVDFVMSKLGIKDRKLAQRISDEFRKWTSNKVPMPSKEGYVDFSSVEHPLFKVKLPDTKEELLKEARKFRPEATLDDLDAVDIRRVSYSKMRRQIAEHYGIPESKAGDLIGTMDCVIHETTEGFATIVPNNLHRCKDLYSHKGYVSKMKMTEMDEDLIEKSLKKSGM